jgi:hypothetical protein
MNYHEEIKRLLKPLSHRLKVRFACECALDVKHLMPAESAASLEVVESWLKGQASQAEVEAAVDAANYAAYYAAYTTTYAMRAAYAAYSAATTSAAYAAYAAYSAANNKEEKMREYHGNLVRMIKNLSELEKIIYNIL